MIKPTAAKSRLLAYLEHTPGFEHRVRHFAYLSVEEILSRVRDQDEEAYQTLIRRILERYNEVRHRDDPLTYRNKWHRTGSPQQASE